MRVSFIMPCYNAAAFLSMAIQSVLTQSYPDVELVIVNDGSTDSSCSVLEYYKPRHANIQLITQENSGAAAALNVGMAACTGDIILVADADDIQEPGRAQLYADSMVEVDFAYSGYYYCNVKGGIHHVERAYPMTKESIASNAAIPGASIGITRKTYHSGIRYRENLRVNYDLGLIIDLYKSKLKYALIDIPTFRYRVLDTGMSYARKKEVEAVTAELTKEL